MIMYAVRRALSNETALQELISQLIDDGQIDGAKIEKDDPLGFLKDRQGEDKGMSGVIDAAYRFCRHSPGAPVVLSGTGYEDHLRQNLASLRHGPLPQASLDRLGDILGGADQASGN